MIGAKLSSMSFRPADTTPEAWAVQLEAWRRMGPERRLSVAVTMSEELISLARSGIAARHPDYTPEAVRLAEIRQRLEDELFMKMYPQAPRFEP